MIEEEEHHVPLVREGYKGPEAAGLSKEEKLEILAAFYADPVLALRELLPHWFPKKMPWVHRGWLALLRENPDFLLNFGREDWQDEVGYWTVDDLKKIESHFVHNGEKLFDITWVDGQPTHIDLKVNDKTVAVMPRGFSKTTLFKADIILDILYQNPECRVQLFISETGPHAAAQVNDIRMELQFNGKITELYGKQAPDRQQPQKWTDEEFETLSGMFLISRGRGGQVRGLNRAATRPGKILFDDLEDEESVSTEDQRKKVKRWFMGALERAGKLRRLGRTRFYGLGTILHFEALIVELQKDPRWMVLQFGAIDNDNEALWEGAMTLEDVEELRVSYASRGELSVFYREVLSKMVAAEDMKFRPDMIQHGVIRREDLVAVGIALDPAISKKKGASLAAFGVTGITDKGQIWVLEAWGKAGMSVREIIDKYFELHFKWNCTHHGIETIAFQQALVDIMTEEMFRKGKQFGAKAYFEIKPILHQTDEAKHKRIEGVLQPRYASGYIMHARTFAEYETALQDWPNSKMDIPDAVAMSVSLLDEFAGLAGDDSAEGDGFAGDVDDAVGDFRHAP